MAADLPVGRMARYAWLLAAYCLPAALAWAAAGLLLNLVPLSHVAVVLIVVYCVAYGITGLAGVTSPRPPGSGWQVPQHLVAGASRPRRILVWGAVLGPGFATRNPYPGFALLVLVIAAVGDVGTGVLAAAAIGIAHGTGRALALLRDTRRVSASDYLNTVMRAMRWRTFDALALLAIGAVVVASLAHNVHHR
jgi:hypothetical protein